MASGLYIQRSWLYSKAPVRSLMVRKAMDPQFEHHTQAMEARRYWRLLGWANVPVETKLECESESDSEMNYLKNKAKIVKWVDVRVLRLMSVAEARLRGCDLPCAGACNGWKCDGDSEAERGGIEE
jgi:hypothetical protein